MLCTRKLYNKFDSLVYAVDSLQICDFENLKILYWMLCCFSLALLCGPCNMQALWVLNNQMAWMPCCFFACSGVYCVAAAIHKHRGFSVTRWLKPWEPNGSTKVACVHQAWVNYNIGTLTIGNHNANILAALHEFRFTSIVWFPTQSFSCGGVLTSLL